MANRKLSIEKKMAKFTGFDRIRAEEIIRPFMSLPSMSIEEINTLADLYCKEKNLMNSSSNSYLIQRHNELKTMITNAIMSRASSVALLRANTADELEDYINQAIWSGMEYLEKYNGETDFYSSLNTIIGRTLDVHTGKNCSKHLVNFVIDVESPENSYLFTIEGGNESKSFFAYSREDNTHESVIERNELKNFLNKVLNSLSPREEGIIRLRFGLVDGIPRTLSEVGNEYNISGNRVRQIEAKALRKLRHPSRSKFLIEFLD